MNNTKEIMQTTVDIVDVLCDMDFLLEKADVFIDEILSDYFYRMYPRSDKAELIDKCDYSIAKIKAEAAHQYIIKTRKQADNLRAFATNALEKLKENNII